jgi:hypothetical protein
MAAFRAAMAAMRSWQKRSATPHEEEDPLFVG